MLFLMPNQYCQSIEGKKAISYYALGRHGRTDNQRLPHNTETYTYLRNVNTADIPDLGAGRQPVVEMVRVLRQSRRS